MRISKVLRVKLESVLQRMVTDRPYCSPDGEIELVRILGYAIDEDGERVDMHEWLSGNKP